MIPRTFPSTFASNGQQQMVVHFLTSVEGLERWSDYIPVKLEQGGPENSYSGCIDVVAISELTADTQAWKEYIPVYADSSATDSWTVNTVGYIPYNYALFAEAALQLDLTNGASLDPRVTFDRTTNATVTGPDGLIAYAPHNLLTFSEQFDNAAWSKTNATVTANAIEAPNGTLTADFFQSSAGVSARVAQTASAIGGATYTASVYARGTAGQTVSFYVDTVGGTYNAWSFAPTTFDGTWQRFTVTLTTNSNNTGLNVTARANTGDTGRNFYLWGAQLEQSSTARAYNPTTVKNLLGFTEHFDNAAWTKSNSFVQTNLLERSEEFDNAYWTKNEVTVGTNTTTAPDGTTTAETLTDTAVSSVHRVTRPVTLAANQVVTVSFFLKKGTSQYAVVMLSDQLARRAFVCVDLDAGTIVEAGIASAGAGASYIDSSIVSAGDGWYRVSVTGTNATGQTIYNAQAGLSNSATPGDMPVYSGTGSTVFAWGAQLVQGTTPGDYKATYAAAAAVGYPDIYGQPFAQKLVGNTSNIEHLCRQFLTLSATTHTLSVYAKAGEYSWVCLTGVSFANAKASFNLSSGTVGTVSGSGSPTASIVSVGNGWYRCSLVFTASASLATYAIALATANDIAYFTGDGTSGIFIFGAQLSDSASVDPYVYQPVAAPTSTAYYGPRFDYDPVTLAPKGLLIEEQRVNYATYSNAFTDSSWVASSLVVTDNSITSPEGTVNATKVVSNLSDALHTFTKNATGLPTSTYSFSIYAKKGLLTKFALREGSATGVYAAFDLNAGIVLDGTGSMVNVGNGWYRCILNVTLVGTTFGMRINLLPNSYTTGSVIDTWAGDGSSELYLFGAQLEAGSFATSYIPTVASQVTRAADSASMIGNNFARWYNVTEGAIFSDADTARVASDSSNIYTITDGTMDNRITSAAATQYHFYVSVAGVAQANIDLGTYVDNVFSKNAGAYKANDFAASLNGSAAGTDTAGSIPVVNRLVLGANAVAGGQLNGHIKRISYFNRRLANTELQAITS